MRLLVLLLALLAPTLAQAQLPVVVSGAPDRVAVTVYRDPERGPDSQLERGSPRSFALISETRTVTLPKGPVVVRFEGVASGIVPQSAILFGTDPRERNRDAALLSQKGLVDAFTGQRVLLRRTNRETGAVTTEEVTVRSAAERLVISGPSGVEAIYCSGLAQTLIYPNAPATLSAKPVLSMTTKDQPGGRVTITLAYLATGFDWDATYVGTLAPDGKSMSLLGWLTLASGDDTSFPDATTAAVAGTVNRSNETRDDTGRRAAREASSLNRGFGCWPAGRTSDPFYPPPRGAPDYARMLAPMASSAMDIVVTARRMENAQGVPIAVTAKSENLGDLKLYRIPVPVTVAARSQKQVAFMVKQRVTGEVVYRARVQGSQPDDLRMLFRFRNRKRDGLGEPLPAGKSVLYQQSQTHTLFIGESSTPDKAIDEEVELVFGEPGNVTMVNETKDGEERPGEQDRDEQLSTIRNANPFPVIVELEFLPTAETIYRLPPGRVVDKPGKRVWIATIPPNRAVDIRYTTIEPQPKRED